MPGFPHLLNWRPRIVDNHLLPLSQRHHLQSELLHLRLVVQLWLLRSRGPLLAQRQDRCREGRTFGSCLQFFVHLLSWPCCTYCTSTSSCLCPWSSFGSLWWAQSRTLTAVCSKVHFSKLNSDIFKLLLLSLILHVRCFQPFWCQTSKIDPSIYWNAVPHKTRPLRLPTSSDVLLWNCLPRLKINGFLRQPFNGWWNNTSAEKKFSSLKISDNCKTLHHWSRQSSVNGFTKEWIL